MRSFHKIKFTRVIYLSKALIEEGETGNLNLIFLFCRRSFQNLLNFMIGVTDM